MFKKIAIAVAVATAIGGVASNAVAGNSTSNLTVSATVNTKCSATTNAVAFGVYDPTAVAAANGVGQVIVTCTKAATGVTIGLSLGANVTGSTRRMLGSPGGDFRTYELYTPSVTTPGTGNCGTGNGSGTIWNMTNLLTPTGVSPWGAGNAKTFEVCGVVPATQDVTAGGATYSDTVVATLTF